MSEYISPLSPRLPDSTGQHLNWGRLYGSAKSLAIVSAAQSFQGILIVMTRDVKTMEKIYDELVFYSDTDVLPLLAFPDWETLPYDEISPYQDIVSDRLETLSRLSGLKQGILLVPVTTAMQRLMPFEYLLSRSFDLQIGQDLKLEAFKNRVLESGYKYVSQVIEHGDMTVRGSIVDVFPMGAANPIRIDLLDDTVDSLRIFNPETQRSVGTSNTIKILPASEIGLTEECISNFRSKWRENFTGNPMKNPLYADVSNGLTRSGIEYYLPLFYEKTSLLFDYLPEHSCVIVDESAIDAAQVYWSDIKDRYDRAIFDYKRQVLQPDTLFVNPEELETKLLEMSNIHISGLSVKDNDAACNFATLTPVNVPVDVRQDKPLDILKRFIDNFNGKVLIVAESPGRRETMLELFRANTLDVHLVGSWSEFLALDNKIALTVSPLDEGALIETPMLAIISEYQLFGERVHQRRLRKRKQYDADAIVRNLAELSIGSPVVHEDHGVGRYRGLITLDINGVHSEFINIEYDRGDKLYVPVSSLDLISRYTGADVENAPLHRLGSNQWQKARKRAEQQIFDVAAELLELHARRASRKGKSFIIDENEYRAFTQNFPFEETPDQQDSIDAVIEDMIASSPMDRLICGDAGFGKTEVAMRATFVCISNNRQVALLVPTTLLAQQHYQNFKDRFADWPVKVEVISRFGTKAEQQRILHQLEQGKVDIIIGTHRLLQEDVKFKDLGLIIIDEEHRFGVRQKEKIKSIKAEVDVLTLTATPIPRTLNMAISDLRALSIIATPPSRRLAVKTFVYEWNDTILIEAIYREIKRGGQIYFLHNEVDSIKDMSEKIQSLVPEARVHYAHGQMPERQLEQVMMDFYHRRFNILVCTTIIESGIDIPTANTIIINRADKLGLAQLYQLRGRVGRSHHRAYAYLLVPSINSITEDAKKRLEAVESLEELGIGFTLAIHDLEIRGAGEILGEEQSGHVHEIGFSLYMELLERAVSTLRLGRQPQLDRPLDHGAEIDVHAPALIPADYLSDVHTRLIMYKRIASAKNSEELQALAEEMIDRFGIIPDAVKNLFKIAGLKIRINKLGVKKIDLGENGGRIQFKVASSVDPGAVIGLIQKHPEIYRFDGAEKLRIIREFSDPDSRIAFLHDLFDMISEKDAA
jgi:transcription-repair coupling factor (superfamily II helicase)